MLAATPLLVWHAVAHAVDLPIPEPTPGQNVVQLVNGTTNLTLLAGAFGPTAVEPREATWVLPPGGYLTIDIPTAWQNTTPGSHKDSPRFWARVGCRYDKDRDITQCETGDCGGRYDCSQAHLAGVAPTTIGEWCFNCGFGFSDWDVSAVDGVALSMDIQPLGTYSPDNPKSPGDVFWCKYPNAVAGADLRASCPDDFQLKRSALGSFIIGSEDGIAACFSNCGKYEYPVAPAPDCPDSDPTCFAWRKFCCNAPASEYGKTCTTDEDCSYGDACWHLPPNMPGGPPVNVCACRGYLVDPPCPDDVCTHQENTAQPPFGVCSEPDCIGDDTVHRVMPRAYSWPNDPQTYDCDASAYRITFAPGGTSVPTTDAGDIPRCSGLPAVYGYATANGLCSGTPTRIFGGAKPSPQDWDCAVTGATLGVLCSWDLACDCNRNSAVAIDELVRAVSIALGQQNADVCEAADLNGDGSVSVDEIVSGVNTALSS